MSRKKTHKEFLEELSIVQPDLILLSNYISCDKRIIVADKLGIEYKCKPLNLLMGKIPTIESAMDKKLAFQIKLNYISPQLKLVSDYINNKERVIIENNGILYWATPTSLLIGRIPTIINAFDKNESFKHFGNEVHSNKYNYDSVNFINSKIKVEINCPVHKTFLQKPVDHLKGYGCMKCSHDNHPGGYGSVYKHFPETKVSIYLFKCYNDNEEFYKVGLSTEPEKRALNIPYKVDIISSYKSTVGELYPIEQNYHKKFKQLNISYKPEKYFGGWTECCK